MADLSTSSPQCGESQQTMLLALSWVLLTIAVLAVSLRLYFRLGLRNGINWDDYTIVASLIAGIIGTAFLTKLVLSGVGRHIYCLRIEQIEVTLKWSILSQILNIIGIGLVKVSVCLCVLRVIDKTRRRLALFLWVLIAFVTVSHFTQVLLFLVQCRPMAAIWNPHIHGKCFSAHVTYLAGYVGFGLDAFTDLICAGIPIFVIHQLQMNTRTKVALCCVMGLGALTAGSAIAKAVVLKGVFEEDYTWAITQPAICTVIEHLLGIVIASVPALKPLFGKVLNVATSSAHSSRRSFRKMSGSEAFKKAQRSSVVNEVGSEDRVIPMNNKAITKTTEFRLSTEHDLELGEHCEPTEAWPFPDFPRPPQGKGWIDKAAW